MVRQVTPQTDSNSKYWDEYSNLQHTKQLLIKHYLQGWFPKIGTYARKIIYFDTHAGRGNYTNGETGSPLTALTTLLEHNHRDRLLANCEVYFYFIEETQENYDQLCEKLKEIEIPQNIHIRKDCGDCFTIMKAVVDDLKNSKSSLAPSFIFIDPYGFKIPGELMRQLLAFEGVELFVNIIWRELNMAMSDSHTEGMHNTVSSVFCGDEWKQAVVASDLNERAEQAVNLLKDKLGAKWGTYIRMRGDNGATRYLLLHLTNHDAGRELMKDCIWKVCPDGGFDARKSDSIQQYVLITPEPDLRPLQEWVLGKLANGQKRWSELLDDLRAELWRGPHLTKVLGKLRKSKQIVAEDYQGRFGPKANPILKLAEAED